MFSKILRTLKQTPRGIKTYQISGMEVFYYTEKDQIVTILDRCFICIFPGIMVQRCRLIVDLSGCIAFHTYK